MFVHANALLDGNALRDGARVCYRKSFDHAKNKDRAEEVTGAYTDPSRPPPRPPPGGMGGGFGGGGGGMRMGGGGGGQQRQRETTRTATGFGGTRRR